MSEAVPCPECGSTQIEPVDSVFIDSYCTDCDQFFVSDFVEFDRAKAELREGVVEAIRSDLQRLRRLLQR
jgi:ribosomal protein S27E